MEACVPDPKVRETCGVLRLTVPVLVPPLGAAAAYGAEGVSTAWLGPAERASTLEGPTIRRVVMLLLAGLLLLWVLPECSFDGRAERTGVGVCV